MALATGTPAPAGFVHAQFCTTPESLLEKQPLWSPDAGLSVTFDGRIDNRDELLDAMRSHGAEPFVATDPALLLAAYRLWGNRLPPAHRWRFRLRAVERGHAPTLVCTRPHRYIRPFYYFHGSKRFLFASDIQSLLTHPAVSLAVSEGMVAEYLARSI